MYQAKQRHSGMLNDFDFCFEGLIRSKQEEKSVSQWKITMQNNNYYDCMKYPINMNKCVC